MLPKLLFLGITIYQFTFVLFQWIIFRKKENTWYLAYIVLMILFFLLLYESDVNHQIEFLGVHNILYFDKLLLFFAYGFYLRFGRLFINMPVLYPGLNFLILMAEWFTYTFSIINFFVLILTDNFWLHAKILFAAFLVVFVVFSYVIIFLMFKKSGLTRFLVSAGLFLFAGTFVSLTPGFNYDTIFTGGYDHMIYLQWGILIELFILNSGLVYKMKIMQDNVIVSQNMAILELRENERLNRKLITIREEISMDLHDEVSGGLATIHLTTELIKRKNLNIVESRKELDKISASSKELAQKINEIVWAMNVSYDSLENLVVYIRAYAVRYLDDLDIHCYFEMPVLIPYVQVAGNNRRSIFLIIKEALNNIAKHADATGVKIRVALDKSFEIVIQDNGKGIQHSSLKNVHNGLYNMKRRASALHGTIEFAADKGTTIILSVPFENLSHENGI